MKTNYRKAYLYLLFSLSLIFGITLSFIGGYKLGQEEQFPTYIPYPVHQKIDDRVLFDLIQNWRKANLLSTYTEDPALCNFALIRSYEIKQEFSHDGFNRNTNLFGYKTLAENLAQGFNSEEMYLIGWLNSPGHRQTLELNFTHSCLRCNDGYCAHEFGM